MAKNADLNQLAASIVEQSTTDDSATYSPPEKNAAAVTLGRLGGLKGGKARAAALTRKQRREIAKRAAAIRWKKIKKPMR